MTEILEMGVAWPNPRFTVSGDCVTDNLTGLMWVKSPDNIIRTWANALTHANDLTLCGRNDWRLPNRKELRSLINYGVDTGSWLNTQGFSNVRLDNFYWSSTTAAFRTFYAWQVYMWDGYVYYGRKGTGGTGGFVWPVRAGQFYNLVITKAGTGTGTVNATGCTLNWVGNTGACTADSDTGITLSGVADAGSTFASWSGGTGSADGCAGTGNCTFNITENSGVTATFTLNTYTVTVNPSDTVSAGQSVTITSNAGGVNCTWNGTAQGGTCTSSALNHGTSVTLTANLPTGTTISWGTGCNTSTATTCAISSLTANTTISPITTATYTVTPSAGANGSINPNTPQTVNHGSTTQFTVTANPGYTASVGGTCGGTLSGNTYTTNTIIADCTVIATFTLNQYTVTPSAGANGTINPNTPQRVNHGATTTFTVTPNAGYTASVGGTCGGTLVGKTYTTNAIIADCTVVATFTNTKPDDPGPEPPPPPSEIIFYYNDPAIQYTGGWLVTTPDPCGYQVMAGHNIGGTNASMSLNFTGASIRWHTITSPQGGWARVYIDGQLVGRVSLYSDITQCDVEVFRYNLSHGYHTIRIVPAQSLPGIMINIYRFIAGQS